ncbi:MAG: hypothetical protein HY875_06840 [Chloroflexi bacterium]|nr:hypothetical protein [Chloroflexota bacterium]
MHPLAWLAWVTLVMVVSLTATNPLYLVVVLLAVVLVGVLAPRTSTAVAGVRTLAMAGTALFLMSLAVAVLNGGYGEHVLFAMPGPDFPGWMGGLRLGGPVAAESLVAAGVRGLSISCVLLAFGVFNGAVSPYRVLRTAPAALFHAGLIVTVGLTLLPSSIEDIRRIREMQALRGGATGVRNLPGLVVPAVIGGLERSMKLAEAMEARGYASAARPPAPARLAALSSAPLLLPSGWAWFYYDSARWLAVAGAVAAAGALLWWATAAAKTSHVTRFRREPLTPIDRAAIGGSLALAAAAFALRSLGAAGLAYNPFAGLAWPEFEPAGALLALAVAWPAAHAVLLPGAARHGELPASAAPEGTNVVAEVHP